MKQKWSHTYTPSAHAAYYAKREATQPASLFDTSDRPVLDDGQTYEDVVNPWTAGVSMDGSNVRPAEPQEFGWALVPHGINRLRSMMRFITPLNFILLALTLVIWGYVLFQYWLSPGLKEFNVGAQAFTGSFDGQRRNDYTTVEPLEGTFTRNFLGSGLLCDFMGIMCISDQTGVLATEKRRPYFVQNVVTGGFNILKYRSTNPPAIAVGSAISRLGCKGLTRDEALRFFCDRDITNESWFRTATQTNEACTTEVDLLGCPQWRACVNAIADTHFSTSKKPGPFSGRPEVAPGRWLEFPTDMKCAAVQV